MLYDKYHEFFSRQCKVLRQKQQLSAKYTIFFIHLREGKFGPGGTGPSSTKGQKKEGNDRVTDSIKIKGRSQSTRWEIFASSCHQGHGNEGTIAASRLSFLSLSKPKVSLEMVVNVGQMSPCPPCNKVSAL